MSESQRTDEGKYFRAQEVDPFPEVVEEAEIGKSYTDWQKDFNQELDRLERQHFYYLHEARMAGDRAGDAHGGSSEAAYQKALAEELSFNADAQKAQEARLELIEGVPAENFAEAEKVRQRRGLFMEDSVHNPKNKDPK